MKDINVDKLKEILESEPDSDNVYYLDVRTPKEFSNKNVKGFQNTPLSKLECREFKKDKKVVVMCASGNRSRQAAKQLIDEGFTEVYNVQGGITSWSKEGYPVQGAGKSVISVMRQVHIILGIGTLVGALGSVYIDPNLVWVAVFFGAGGLFSGLSGICAMAELLERMPWNR